MATFQLLLCFAVFPFLFTISSCSHHQSSIAEAPDCSSFNGRSMLHGVSSFLLKGSQFASHGSRKLVDGSHRGRLLAQATNQTSQRKNQTVIPPASAPAPAPAPLPPSSKVAAEPNMKKQKPVVKWLTGIALGLATGAISGVIASFVYKVIHDYVKRPKPNKPVVFQRKVIDKQALAFLEKDGAIDNLEELGRGGSGAVYKATFENGRVVAIKKVMALANAQNGGGIDPILEKSYDLTKNSAQVKAELATLGQIRHRNLLTLLAYIPKQNAHMLVYDYMENGSLHDAILKVQAGMLELSWPTRLKIAEGVAMGLKYLHFDCNPRILHCDLKPANILLDKEMKAHIGDFGVAKIIPDSFTHFTGNDVAGTVGYIAPEYHQTLKYTVKGDVYAYGVVLVVLVTGKEPTQNLFSDVYTHMGDWVMNVLGSGEQSMRDVFDPQLQGGEFEKEILDTLKLAAHCLKQNPPDRPTSQDILNILAMIRSSANPTHNTHLSLLDLGAT